LLISGLRGGVAILPWRAAGSACATFCGPRRASVQRTAHNLPHQGCSRSSTPGLLRHCLRADAQVLGASQPLGGPEMTLTLYRVYFVDCDGHVHSAENVECVADAAAIMAAVNLETTHPVVEVWEGARVVGRMDRIPRGSHSPRAPVSA